MAGVSGCQMNLMHNAGIAAVRFALGGVVLIRMAGWPITTVVLCAIPESCIISASTVIISRIGTRCRAIIK